MAMNKFMHSRNKYKTPPDFGELAMLYPEFQKVAKMDISGKVKVNFKDPETIRILTQCLLKKDFNLTVNFPPDKLIPTLPLRLNYILWIEDIMNYFQLENPKGIDIGCGASCIYPLLAVKLNNWTMEALEIDEKSYATAFENVTQNHLDDKIKIVQQHVEDLIFSNCSSADYGFCMCNPPFYNKSEDDLAYDVPKNNNRSGRRKEPNNGATGSDNELFVEGGEVNFVEKIIKASMETQHRIKVYTTMLGHKSSVKIVSRKLKENGISNTTTTEFCQGNTTRWGVAWSYCDKFQLKDVLQPPKSENTVNKTHFQKFSISQETNVTNVCKTVRELLEELKASIKVLSDKNGVITWKMAVQENTWSNQRRKRREMKRKGEQAVENEINLQREQIRGGITKPILQALVCIGKEGERIVLSIGYLSGIAGKDGVHQILQYIKNNWK